jgi:TRAP transporter TAXI family solute receptor
MSANVSGSTSLDLSTGGLKGVYYPVGRGIADAAGKEGLKVKVLNSHGSIENIKLISDEKVQLGIAQGDIAYNAYNGEKDFSRKITEFRAIASLYTEAVHIFIRNPLFIEDIDDFRGKRISIGAEGSGTASNAMAILDTAGIALPEFQLFNTTIDQTIKAFEDGTIDIAFITSGVPSEAGQLIAKNDRAYLFDMKPVVIERLVKKYPYYVVNSIPEGAYNNKSEITTIGIPALLLVSNKLDENTVYRLTKSIFENTNIIAAYHNAGNRIGLKTALKGVNVSVAGGAVRFYKEAGLYRKQLYRKILNALFIGLLFVLFIIAVLRRDRIIFFFKTRELARVVVFLIVVWSVGSLVLYIFENKFNDSYSNIYVSFWSGLITMISMPDKEPYTFTGRVTGVLMMVMAAGGIAWFTGQVASIFVHRRIMGRNKMEKMKDHYVIANWNRKGYGIIESIHSAGEGNSVPIIIVNQSSGDKKITLPDNSIYESVYTVEGCPTNEHILRRANVQHARSAIILPEDISDTSSDASSILTILAIRKICLDEQIKPIPVIAEILDPQKVELAIQAGTEGDGHVEIVSPQRIGSRLIAQAAVNPGLTEVYRDLLTFDKNNCEIYRRKIPSVFIGESVDGFFRLISSNKIKGRKIIPIGIYRNGKSYINPIENVVSTIEDGDFLYAISYEEIDLSIIDNLQKS